MINKANEAGSVKSDKPAKTKKIALIGRANVGKSTLFNTLLEEKKAIVSEIAGTTRDRNYAKMNWRGAVFELIDTGGIDIIHPSDIEKDILYQAEVAEKEADLILFLVDAKTGLMPQDKKVAHLIKKNGHPTLLVANKADSKKLKESVAEFYQLNLGEPLPVSALNGTGTGDLLDKIVEQIKTDIPAADPRTPAPTLKIAIIGKPNTGKSSLVNAILGEERLITSATPYTTRDSQDIELTYKNQHFILIDTAGIRKKAKIRNKLEIFSVGQSLASIKRADVTLLMTDVSEPLGKQDKTLSSEIKNAKTSLIIVANKWDKIKEKDDKTINKFIEYYQYIFPFLSYAPIIFISALEKQRVHKILDLAGTVYQERFRQITDNAMDKFLKWAIKKNLPPKAKGTRPPRLLSFSQVRTNPPTFILKIDSLTSLANSYLRFLVKTLHQKFGFQGTPINIRLEAIDTKHSSKKKKAL